jgi:cell wall-associated NlpC family hydrolase
MSFKAIGTAVVAVFLLAEPTPASDVVDYAARFIGRPYIWGAEGPNNFDCSGLTQYVFGRFDIELPRRAVNQSTIGKRIRTGLQRGDLVFFATDARKSLVTHVGIYEGNGRMIEASKSAGHVRRSDLDDSYWVERFMFARRVLQGIGTDAPRDRRAENDGEATPSRAKQEVRRAAVRALTEIAGALLRRPR